MDARKRFEYVLSRYADGNLHQSWVKEILEAADVAIKEAVDNALTEASNGKHKDKDKEV